MGLFTDRRGRSSFYSRVTTINVLRFLWIVTIIWCEVGAFFWSLSDCRWPDSPWRKTDKHASPSHVMIIADPHFKHSRLLKPSSTSYFKGVGEFLVHLNLRKSWNAVSRLNPHIVIVLGDMLDKGRSIMTDEEYDKYHQAFTHTFKHNRDTQFYYVTGNHDVGLGSHRSFSGQSRRRFRQNFGPEQQVFEFGNHTFVAIDAPGLVDEDYRRNAEEADFESWQGAKSGPISFVKAIKNTHANANKPAILLTHMPLARPESASCGPHREHPRGIRRGAGYGYQNLLGKHTTHFVLQSIRPALVFSGDDHDYCDYIHRSNDGDVREVTVRTISMAEGVDRPGFQLLSLYTPPHGTPLRADTPCLLPNQKQTYTLVYLPLFFITVAYLVYINFTVTASKARTKGLGLEPIRLGPTINNEPPTPKNLSVRRMSVPNSGMLTPRSRPASPNLSATVLFNTVDEEDFSIDGARAAPSPYLSASPSLLPSVLPHDPEAGDDLPPLTPSSRANGNLKRWLKGDEKDLSSWRVKFQRIVDTAEFGLQHYLIRFSGRSRSNEKLWVRVSRDLFQTWWPPALVTLFIWWRLFYW